MAFLIDFSAPLDDEVRRIALEQIDKVQTGIDEDDIHSARKAVKRTRALLRLVDPKLRGKDDRHLRDLGRSMAGARDLEVLIALLEQLAPELPSRDPVDAAAAQLRAEASTLEPHVDDARRLADKIAERATQWTVDAGDLEPGFRAVYKQARTTMRAAMGEPTGHRLHEWRKQVKYHWHHCELLGDEERADAVHVVADRLGDDHDLVVLCERFPAVRGLQDVVAARQRGLREEAFDLGGTLFSESPREAGSRFGFGAAA